MCLNVLIRHLVRGITSFSTLITMCHQLIISPHSITLTSNNKVMRIKEMITMQPKKFLIVKQILYVWRICILMLGCNGLISYICSVHRAITFFNQLQMNLQVYQSCANSWMKERLQFINFASYLAVLSSSTFCQQQFLFTLIVERQIKLKIRVFSKINYHNTCMYSSQNLSVNIIYRI